MSGIYIHIPFCKQACNYCDFHFSTNLSNKLVLINAIITEIKIRGNYLKNEKIETIYFGGGTPSLLTELEFELLFETLNKNFVFESLPEITLEANPEDIHEKNLGIWKNLGINRLSIGIQSFNDVELKWMNRIHTAKQSINSVLLAQDTGFENITIDLIYGSKFQSLNSWEKTIIQAIELNTKHISTYNLTIENKTALGQKNLIGKEPSVNDNLSTEQFLIMTNILQESGFIHYEISNFGKQGFFAKHNSNYWLQKNYLGVGPSAHSFNGYSRQWNVKNNTSYIKALENKTHFFDTEQLLIKDQFNEYLLTRLRTIWGCEVNEIKFRFGEEIYTYFLKNVEKNKNYFILEDGVFKLTKEARLYADGIASKFFLD